MKRIALGVTIAWLAACTPPTPAATPVSATAVGASFGKTWNAVVNVLADRTINVKTMDRSSGFVTAQASEMPKDSLKKYTTNCGGGGIMASLLLTPSDQAAVARYNILVTGDSAASSVRVTTQTIMDFGSGVTLKCLTNGVFENSIQGEVKARAEQK